MAGFKQICDPYTSGPPINLAIRICLSIRERRAWTSLDSVYFAKVVLSQAEKEYAECLSQFWSQPLSGGKPIDIRQVLSEHYQQCEKRYNVSEKLKSAWSTRASSWGYNFSL